MSELKIEEFNLEAMKAGAALTGPIEIPGGYPAVVLPQGWGLHNMQALLKPELANHRSATLTMKNHGSFIEYLKRYAGDTLLVLATRGNEGGGQWRMSAVLDYHGDGPDGPVNWLHHRVNMTLETTDAWGEWQTNNGKQMSQVDFARFIEKNLLDVIEPSHANIMQVASKMEAKRNVSFRSEYEITNGQMKFLYDEDVKGTVQGGSIEIPQLIKVKLAPFKGYKLFEFSLRLRWRLDKDKLAFYYEMVRPLDVLDAVFDGIIGQVQSELGTKVLEGSLA